MGISGTKVAIVGAGSVGATIAYACMTRGVARHFAMFDQPQAVTAAIKTFLDTL